MIELQWRWTGWAGGPGYSTFHTQGPTSDVQEIADTIDVFWGAMAAFVPSGISIRSTGTWRELAVTTGDLLNLGTLGTLPPNHPGTGNAAFASTTGMCVDWLTLGHGPSRPRVGRTYLVPLTSFLWATDGTVNDVVVTAVQAAATALATDPDARLQVWHRPAAGGADGAASDVLGARVKDKAMVLRSRRD